MLNPNMDWAMNPQRLEAEYQKNERLYIGNLTSFKIVEIKGDERKLTPQQTTPYSTDLFDGYFIDTYYALCQVCAKDARDLIPNCMLVICMDIRRRDINRPFYFDSLVAVGLHNALYGLKDVKSSSFKYYSLLMHIFLYKGLKVWHPNLQIITVVKGEQLSPRIDLHLGLTH